MPRVKQDAARYAMEDLVKQIRAAGSLMGLNTVHEIADQCGVPYRTMLARIEKPESMKLGELLQIVQHLRMSPEQLAPIMRGGATR